MTLTDSHIGQSQASVLIVEDDPRAEALERALLEGSGYAVTSAVSGEEAIELVSNSDPDLILLDIGLPGIDGFTACKVIRKFSQAPIIMVTGGDSTADKVRGMETGADDYITKPFAQEEFLARASTVLRRANFANMSVQPPEMLAEVSAKYTVRTARKASKPDRAKSSALSDHPRWKSLQQTKQRLGQRIAQGLASTRRELAKDGRIIYVNITGKDLPRRDQSGSAWRYYSVIARTLFGTAIRAFEQLIRSLALGLYSWSNTQFKKAKSNWQVKKLSHRVAESGESVREPSSPKLLDAARNTDPTPPISERPSVLAERTNLTISEATRVDKSDEALQEAQLQLVQPNVAADSSRVSVAERSVNAIFLDALLRVYLVQAQTKCEAVMLAAPIIPLVDVLPLMAESLGKGLGYTKEEFAQDIYRLQLSGLDTTTTGARIQLPISRGVPGKVLTAVDNDGEKIRYYGIRFIAADRASDKLSEARYFDLLEGPLYGMEIRDLLGKQLDWPSAEFSAFFANQLQLAELTDTELRQFAQITRDSLQRFVQEQATLGRGI